jgi:hypothetical protein
MLALSDGNGEEKYLLAEAINQMPIDIRKKDGLGSLTGK